MSNNQNTRQSEKGNVLFLILIAVALFAALSYVVTQSTRSGGGSTEREKNILSSAQMTQYPTALRTSLIRQVLAGVAIENVKFNSPGSFSPSVEVEVFHPQGGGATYQAAPAELMAGTGGTQGVWTYNAEVYVPGIGIDTVGGNDVIAFLPGVSDGVCRQVNEELGIDTNGCTMAEIAPSVPAINTEVDATMNTAYSFPSGPGTALTSTDVSCTTVFDRQASGCFFDIAGDRNVFYSVLLER